MKIPKKVAVGMMIGGLVGIVGSAGAGLYDSLSSEKISEPSIVYVLGIMSSFALYGAGADVYSRRRKEEREPFNKFREEFSRYFQK